MKQFDEEVVKEKYFQQDILGRKIEVGDIVLKAVSGTKMDIARVDKVCSTIVKLTIIQSPDVSRKGYSYWSCSSALYILEKNEKNNI